MPTELHHVLTGPPASKSDVMVLWVHGVDSDSTVWTTAIDLVAADHPCVAIDLPGHGSTDSPTDEASYRRDTVLTDIDAVLDTLRADNPDVRFVWVGHSLGGYLGMAHALTRSDAAAVDALVLVSTGPGFRDPDAMRSWNERVRANAPDYTVSETAATIAFHHDSIVMERLAELSVPTALVVGDATRPSWAPTTTSSANSPTPHVRPLKAPVTSSAKPPRIGCDSSEHGHRRTRR